MAQQNGKCSLNPDAFSSQCLLTGRKGNTVQRGKYTRFCCSLEKQFNGDGEMVPLICFLSSFKLA